MSSYIFHTVDKYMIIFNEVLSNSLSFRTLLYYCWLFIRFHYLARYWTICGFYTLLWLFAIWFGVRHVLKVDQHCRIWQVFEEQIIVLDSLVRMMMIVSLFLKVTTEAPKFSSRSGWGDLLVIKLPAKSPTIRWWWLPQWWSMEMCGMFDWPKSLHLLIFLKHPFLMKHPFFMPFLWLSKLWSGLLQMIILRATAVKGGIGDSSSWMKIALFLCKIRFRTHMFIFSQQY